MALAYFNPRIHDLEIENQMLKMRLKEKQLEKENEELIKMLE